MASNTAPDSRFFVALAAVFGGVAATLVVVGVAASLAALPVAAVFAAVAGIFYYHGSGRLRARLVENARRRRANRADAGAGRRGTRRGNASRGPRWQGRRRRTGATNASSNTRDARQRREDPLADAYRVLDLEPGASMDAVKAAYREKTRALHPDRGGDPDAFAQVNRAYERLRDAKA